MVSVRYNEKTMLQEGELTGVVPVRFNEENPRLHANKAEVAAFGLCSTLGPCSVPYGECELPVTRLFRSLESIYG